MPDQEPQPHDAASELASFGEDLRREREIRGISLKEIADATKISKRFLDALERNDHKTLPAPVFTRGFVREYSRYVGLNAEEMVNRYNFAAAKDDRIEKPPQVAKYAQIPPRDITPKPPAKRGIPSTFERVNRNAIIAVVIALALAAVTYWAVQRKTAEHEVAETTSTVPLTTRAATAPHRAPTTPPKQDDATLRLDVEAREECWVELEADGERAFKDTMQIGERRKFEAKNQFRFVVIGNAAGLSLTLNGVTVPALGDEGDTLRNRTFDRESLAKLRAQGPS
ncbi:MAG TPA: helix-turn-helix domain-containing protein [Thermoanaerobaculia bacterium]|jgi:cytoskeletal protein RodZ